MDSLLSEVDDEMDDLSLSESENKETRNDDGKDNKEAGEKDRTETETEEEVATMALALVINDIGYLDFDEVTGCPTMTDSLRTNLVNKGPDVLQNQDKIGSALLHNGRRLTKSFFSKLVGSERNNLVPRRWLLYSPEDKSLYCFCCLLYGKETCNIRSNFTIKGGFTRWKKSGKVSEHETSQTHRNAFTTWKEAERRIALGLTVDDRMEAQILEEKKRW